MLSPWQKLLPAALRPYAKAIAPAVLVTVGVLARWALTGEWDAAQWAAAVTGLVAATVTYLVPNAQGLFAHPQAVATDFLADRPVPTAAPLLPDETERDVAAAAHASARAAERTALIRPLPPGSDEPPARTGPIETTRTTVSGKLVPFAAQAARAVSHTQHYVNVASRHGCRKGLALVIIARSHARGIPVSLGFAIIGHESGFRKVFGHDPTIYVGAGLVTRAKFLAYRAVRRASGNRLMQGVGEGQLTWWATQDAADARGGCWRAEPNVDTSYVTLAANIHAHGYVIGIERYNGTGPAAVEYSHQVRAQAAYWHHVLTEGLA